VRPKVLGGQIFSAFSRSERELIWTRLEIFDGLIPSLFTFFQDINYLQLCVDCVKRLVYVPRGINSTVSSSLRRRLKYVRGGECRIVIQVAEDRFISRPGSLEERADLGIRQLYACAMQTILICPKAGTRESGKEAGSKSEQGGAPQASRPCCSSRIRV
jgi:hypothetical protein